MRWEQTKKLATFLQTRGFKANPIRLFLNAGLVPLGVRFQALWIYCRVPMRPYVLASPIPKHINLCETVTDARTREGRAVRGKTRSGLRCVCLGCRMRLCVQGVLCIGKLTELP